MTAVAPSPQVFARLSWVSQAAKDHWLPVMIMIRSDLALLGPEPGADRCCTDPVVAGLPDLCRYASDGPQVSFGPGGNPLLRRLGLAYVTHPACRPDCPATAALAGRRATELEAQSPETRAALDEILSWPMEWSLRGGVAQVRTPVFRHIYPVTGPQPAFTAFSVPGVGLPTFSGQGSRFPYAIRPAVVRRRSDRA